MYHLHPYETQNGYKKNSNYHWHQDQKKYMLLVKSLLSPDMNTKNTDGWLFTLYVNLSGDRLLSDLVQDTHSNQCEG